MMTAFAHLGLADDLLRAIEDKGYTAPSPIQERAIPAILEGRDVMAAAQTGTGKTAGFTLPLLQLLRPGKSAASNHCRALVLTPTRELAAQVGESVATYGQHMGMRSAVVYGGVKINPQMMALRKGADVLVATPGRLMDLHQQNAVNFNDVEILVLDEADRMLDMGFIHDIKKILALLPAKRQNLLFSATFSDEIRQLAMGILNDPIEINISPKNSTAETVDQWIHPVDKTRKAELLSHLITSRDWRQALVFTRTKHGANKLAAFLNKEEIRSSAIHGNKSQAARLKALEDFKRGRVNILVATDIAARGLDIVELPQVVNFDLPNVPEDYVHRIGRTGRAGSKGRAISLVSADEFHQLWDIEKLIDRKLTRDTIKGFEPEHAVPDSKGLKGAPAVSKPKVKPQSRRPDAGPKIPRAPKAPAAVKLESTPAEVRLAPDSGDGTTPARKRLSRNIPAAPPVTAPAVAQPSREKRAPYEGGERGPRPNHAKPGFKKPPHKPYEGKPKQPYEGKPKPAENTDRKPHGGSSDTRSWQNKPKPNAGGKPAYAGKRPNNPRPAYVGVYQRPADGDYRTEEKLQSFGNRADIPLDKLKALDDKPQKRHHNNSPRGAGGYNNGQPKPYSGGYKGKSTGGYQGTQKPYNTPSSKPAYANGSGSYVSPGSASDNPGPKPYRPNNGGGYKGYKKPNPSGDDI
jgi:ATP-dependent RNA helicase RhlE